MKPIIIFRQGGNNVRIGNTLVWVTRAYAWCMENQFEFFYPTGRMVLEGVVEDDSPLLTVPDFLRDTPMFKDCLVEQRWSDIDRFLKRFFISAEECVVNIGNKNGEISIFPGMIALIRGSRDINWSADSLLNFIRDHRLIVIDEPFPFQVQIEGEDKWESDLLRPSRLIERSYEDFRSKSGITVGIHVRQTDYIKWQGGRHYKDNSFYNELIRRVSKVLSKDDVLFIAHDGEFIADRGMETCECKIRFSSGSTVDVVSDFISFACCDYIFGPVSTFTGQASQMKKRWFGRHPVIVRMDGKLSVEENAENFIVNLGRV